MQQEAELLQLEAKIARSKDLSAQASGALAATMATLKSEHGVDTLEQAEALRSSLASTVVDMTKQLDAQIAEIRTVVGSV